MWTVSVEPLFEEERSVVILLSMSYQRGAVLLVGVLTSLAATARTIRASVVWITCTIIVAEFDDYKVSFLE